MRITESLYIENGRRGYQELGFGCSDCEGYGLKKHRIRRSECLRTYSSPAAPLGLLSGPSWGTSRVLHKMQFCGFFMTSRWHPDFSILD